MFLRSLSSVSIAVLVVVLLPTITNARLYGINYSLRNGPDWFPDDTRCKSITQVTNELQQISTILTNRIRIYSMTDCNSAEIILTAASQINDMEVWLGIWIGENGFNFDTERARMLELMNLYDFTTYNVIGIHVSSEAIYREELTVEEAIQYRNVIKSDLDSMGYPNIPVTIADIIDTNIEFPALITVDTNVVTFNQFPFWENTVSIDNAATYMSERVALVESQAGGRQIIITETGWADAGSHPDANVASPSSMTQWLQDFICLASSRNWGYFWFDSYDSDWRRLNENDPNGVEGHFGIFYQNGTIKPHLQGLTFVCGDGGTIVQPPTPSTVVNNVTAPTTLPSLAPITVVNTTTTIPTTGTPTSTPTLLVVETTIPTAIPTSTIVPTDRPTGIASDSPTTSPSFIPTLLIVGESVVPSSVPSDVPSSGPDSAQCDLNPICAELNVQGECCPTPEGVTLLCCGSGVVEEFCENNNRCVEFELNDGMCCPTSHEDIPEIHNKYLDCCGVLPDECQININSTEAENSKCQFMSTVDYKLLYEQFKRDAARSGAVTTTTNTRLVVMTVVSMVSYLVMTQI